MLYDTDTTVTRYRFAGGAVVRVDVCTLKMRFDVATSSTCIFTFDVLVPQVRIDPRHDVDVTCKYIETCNYMYRIIYFGEAMR